MTGLKGGGSYDSKGDYFLYVGAVRFSDVVQGIGWGRCAHKSGNGFL